MSNDIPFLPSAQTPLTRPGCRQQLPLSLGLQPLTKFVEGCLQSERDLEMATLKINKWIKISYCHCRRILYILCHRKINPVYQRRVVKWYSPFVMSRKAAASVEDSFAYDPSPSEVGRGPEFIPRRKETSESNGGLLATFM